MHRLFLPVDKYLDTPHLSVKLSTSLTRLVRSKRIAGPVGTAQARCLVLVALLLFNLTGSTAYANEIIKAKQFALNTMTPIDYQYAVLLIQHESGWRVAAKNGPHYGLCQARNASVKDMGYKEQLTWCMDYWHYRYGTVEKAWLHWVVYQWQ